MSQVQSIPPSSAAAIAAFATGLSLGDVPAAVRERARLHILDALGLGLASNAYDYGRSAVAGVAAMGGSGSCSVLGRSERLEMRDAALVNGILIHGLDFDDTHLASIIHPTCTSLPAALALGEMLDSDGEALLAAVLAGSEIAIRIGGAARGGFHHVGYHATGVVSHFASAVTAGRLMGLDAQAITMAQGIAGSTASGIQVFLEEGAWTKRLHPGWGAVAGITAAHLAKHGYKGPTRPYEGKFGLFETHLHDPETSVDLAELTEGLGEDWRIHETALKPYPVCHFIHGCADAAIELHDEVAGAKITGVDAFLPEPTLPIVAAPAEVKRHPSTDYEAKFSAQFVVAACLLKGRFGLPDLQPDAIADPAIQALSHEVVCHADPDTAFPTYFSGGVTVKLADGRTLLRHVPVNSGAGARAMTADAVADKFMASATLTLAPAQAEAIRDAVLNLERVRVRDLTALLRGS